MFDKKKSKLQEIYQDFIKEISEGMNILNACIDDFIKNKLDREKLKEIILYEKRADRLKENFIELLYKKKRLLPILVEDRYTIVTSFDKIMGIAELTARTLGVYPFEIKENFKEDVEQLNLSFIKTIEALVEAIKTIEVDFKTTIDYIVIIATLRRKAYDFKFEMLSESYKTLKDPIELKLFDDLISLIYEIISKSEQLSDFLNLLIIKYPNQ